MHELIKQLTIVEEDVTFSKLLCLEHFFELVSIFLIVDGFEKWYSFKYVCWLVSLRLVERHAMDNSIVVSVFLV